MNLANPTKVLVTNALVSFTGSASMVKEIAVVGGSNDDGVLLTCGFGSVVGIFFGTITFAI